MRFTVRGCGTPVLFIHGIPTSGRLWDYLVQVLQHEFKCIAVDLPGMGKSPPLTDACPNIQRYAEELEGVREHLSIPAWHVVGHDAGSTVAVYYAVRFSTRVTRLVLCSPPVFPELKIPWLFRTMRIRVLGDCLAPFVNPLIWRIGMQRVIKRHDAQTPGIIRAFRQPFAGYSGARRFIRILRWGDPKQVLGRTSRLLPQIGAATLIIQGKRDGAVPPDFAARAAAIIPNAELEMLDTGHFVPLECPDLLADRLSRFLKG